MNRTSFRFRLVVCSLVPCAAMILESPRAFALVIDDFTQGGLSSLQATNYNGVPVLQTGLDPLRTLGGTRSVQVGSLGLATASVDPTNGRFHFTANSGLGYFALGWGTVVPLNVNLLNGNNQFRIEFVDTTPNTSLGGFDLRIKSGGSWSRYGIGSDLAQALQGNTFGTLSVPFARFVGVDFAHVQAIELNAIRVPAGFHLSIDSFTAVPEPSVAMLLLLGPLLMRLARCARK